MGSRYNDDKALPNDEVLMRAVTLQEPFVPVARYAVVVRYTELRIRCFSVWLTSVLLLGSAPVEHRWETAAYAIATIGCAVRFTVPSCRETSADTRCPSQAGTGARVAAVAVEGSAVPPRSR